MRINRSHPLLKGCRIFMVPEPGGYVRNLMGKTGATVQGSPTIGPRLGRLPSFTLTNAGDDFYQLDGMASYGLLNNALTCLMRVKMTTAPTNGNVYGLLNCRTGSSPTTSAGFVWELANIPGSGDPSQVFAVFGSDGGLNYFRASDPDAISTYANADTVVAARWQPGTQTITLFRDGGKVATTTAGGGAYDVRETTNIQLGAMHVPGLSLQGSIGWTMLYDRALSDGEVFALMRDSVWPFARPEGAPPGNFQVASYRSVVSAAPGYAPGGPVTYTTVVDASAFLDGDLTAGPAPSTDPTYRNVVGVRPRYVGDIPEVVRYANRVGVESVLTATAPVSYRTVVRVGKKSRNTIDGRADLLGTFRYRR